MDDDLVLAAFRSPCAIKGPFLTPDLVFRHAVPGYDAERMPRSIRRLGLLSLLWFAYLAASSDALYAPSLDRDSSVGYAVASLAPDHLDYAKPLFVRVNATICPSERVLEALTLAAQLDTAGGYNHFVTAEKCHYLPANLKITVDAKYDAYRRVRYRNGVGTTLQSGWLIWNELKN